MKLAWQNPLHLAQKIADSYNEDWVFLYSGLHKKIKNSTSYIALFPREKIICDNFKTAEAKIKNGKEKWFGYLSYEVAHDFEKLPKTKKSFINLPKIHLINFSLILEFDHDKKILTAICDDKKILKQVQDDEARSTKHEARKCHPELVLGSIKNIYSNFTDKSYLKTIANIREMIAKGDFYQTNLTRKFFGEFTQKQNQQSSFQLFTDLVKSSPANYSSFLRLDKNFIVSSSPELFLEIKNGRIISRPVKGTMPRSANAKEDHKNKLALKNSAKERAENLMIVDLVRNDLSRICKAGSVAVKKLFTITSYKNIHHMSSEIHGILNKNSSTIDAIKATFPAGSMTGAPKIKAMEIAAKKEKMDRGIYSGCIGFLDGTSKANLSVVIRTLILQGKKFEFQTGGAITFNSDSQAELLEIFSKAKAIIKALDATSFLQFSQQK